MTFCRLQVKYGKLSLNKQEYDKVYQHFLNNRKGMGLGFQQFFKEWNAEKVLKLSK